MSDIIYIAIVSASSAILGALIPSLFSYFTKGKEFNNNLSLMNLEIKRKEYSLFIASMQSLMNDPLNEDGFILFQKSVNNILLFADDNTATNINRGVLKIK